MEYPTEIFSKGNFNGIDVRIMLKAEFTMKQLEIENNILKWKVRQVDI